MRSESSSEARRSRARRDGEDATRGVIRRPASAADLQQFRALLETKPAPENAQVRDPLGLKIDNVLDDKGESGSRRKAGLEGGDAGLPADVSAMLFAQRVMTQSAPQVTASATPTTPSPQLAELIEKQVTRMLVSESARTGARDASVRLQLADTLLPGTELSLTRGESGWHLRADVRSHDSYKRIRDCGEELVRRFAERGLGTINFEPVLHD
jgi:hypothetical protein